MLQRGHYVGTTDVIQNGLGMTQRMGVCLTVATVTGSPSDSRRLSDSAGEVSTPALKRVIRGSHGQDSPREVYAV